MLGPFGARLLGVTLCVLVLSILVGCGTPEFIYVANSDDRTYAKIPSSWKPMDPREVGALIGYEPSIPHEDVGLWIEGYDADPAPSPVHLFGIHAAAPAVFIRVQQIPPATRGQYSFDRLRDQIFPVSAAARERLSRNPGSPFTDFGLITDEVLTPGDGLRGVHVVYLYRVADGPLQIFEQTAYLNDDASKVYLILVRCSYTCYQERKSEIQGVVSSFTVREGT